MNKHIREHQTRRSLHGWHFDQMRRTAPQRIAPRSDKTRSVCAIPGCSRAIRPEYLMCVEHWHMVSIPTQRAVYATWRAYSANGRTPHDGNRYRQARAQAIAEVTGQSPQPNVAEGTGQSPQPNLAEGNALGPNPALDPRPERASHADAVCEHGTALDVHCCNCHSGFLFNPDACECGEKGAQP